MKRNSVNILIVGLLATGFTVFGYLKITKSIQVDSCLDKGGRWNYETNQCETDAPNEVMANAKKDTTYKVTGYNELADEGNLRHYGISEYNTDLENIKNIDRPKTSQLIDIAVDTSLLFNIWTLDPKGPHADFWIRRGEFFVVDYDGDGAMPYILDRDSLTIFYNDFIQKGRILKVTSENLTIKWNDADGSTDYLRWKN